MKLLFIGSMAAGSDYYTPNTGQIQRGGARAQSYKLRRISAAGQKGRFLPFQGYGRLARAPLKQICLTQVTAVAAA